ncbi:MAG: exosortase O [Myxococcota bacterium]
MRRDLLQNLLLLAALSFAFRDGLQWLSGALLQGDGRYHGLLGVILFGVLLSRSDLRALWRPLRLGAAPVMVLLAGLALGAVSRWEHLRLLEALAAVIAGYGALGLLVSPEAWRRSRLPTLLLLLVVPSMSRLQGYLGFPARVLTAQLVSDALSLMGAASVDTGTVLHVEGQETYIDLPCSGMRSLWTGAAFYVAASWLEERRAGVLWALIGAAMALTLMLFNALRVGVLVGLSHVAQQPLLASVLHEPMGMIGFGVACLGAWAAIRFVLPAAAISPQTNPPRMAQAPHWLRPALMAAALAVGLQVAATAPVAPLPLPPPAGATAIPLLDAEAALMQSFDARAFKARFRQGGLEGEVVMVRTHRFRAQHQPDVCLRAGGATLEAILPHELGGIPVRLAMASTHADQPATAVWWYQSATLTTDDYAHRIFAGLGRRAPWIMVSLLVEGHHTPDDPLLSEVVQKMHDHANTLLQREES